MRRNLILEILLPIKVLIQMTIGSTVQIYLPKFCAGIKKKLETMPVQLRLMRAPLRSRQKLQKTSDSLSYASLCIAQSTHYFPQLPPSRLDNRRYVNSPNRKPRIQESNPLPFRVRMKRKGEITAFETGLTLGFHTRRCARGLWLRFLGGHEGAKQHGQYCSDQRL